MNAEVSALKEAVESLSLILTVPTVFLSLTVVGIWGKEAWRILKSKTKTAHQWLILGIVLSFVGEIVDNAYWGIAWSTFFIDRPTVDFWFANGVFANLPFRQGCGLAAAYCHIKSAQNYLGGKKYSKHVNWALFTTMFAGVAFWLFLLLMR